MLTNELKIVTIDLRNEKIVSQKPKGKYIMTATVNYTENQTEEMVYVYKDSKNEAERSEAVNQLANKFGKSVQSIRAKLSREDVYISANKAKAKNVVRKADMVQTLSDLMGIEGNSVESLEKATVQALELLILHMEHMDNLVNELVTPQE